MPATCAALAAMPALPGNCFHNSIFINESSAERHKPSVRLWQILAYSKIMVAMLNDTSSPLMTTPKFNPTMERIKCAGKITGVTAKWVVLWPALGVCEFARSCHAWRKNDLVSRSTTTFYPPNKIQPACDTSNSNLEGKDRLPQDGAEKFFKGLGLTIWFLRHWGFVAPLYMVEECQLVHMKHKATMNFFRPLPESGVM